MSAQAGIQLRVTPEVVGSVMGLQGGQIAGLRGLPWILLMEEAKGVKREVVAGQMRISVEDLNQMVSDVIGAEERLRGEYPGVELTQEQIQHAAEVVWSQGIAAVKMAEMARGQILENSWDTVEALAIDKLSQYLQKMPGTGDPKEMIAIAAQANKAQRRARGEGMMNRGPIAGVTPGEMAVAMQTQQNADGSVTHVGMMTLSLSPKVREQLEGQNREIEGAAQERAQSQRAIEMLSLSDVRKMADDLAGVKVGVSDTQEKEETKQFDFSSLDFSAVIESMNHNPSDEIAEDGEAEEDET